MATSYKAKYPKGGRRCKCRVPGCRVRRDTPQQIRTHRINDHGETATKRRKKASAAKRLNAVSELPSRPMARVRRTKEAHWSRTMLHAVPDDVLMAEVADRLSPRERAPRRATG